MKSVIARLKHLRSQLAYLAVACLMTVFTAFAFLSGTAFATNFFSKATVAPLNMNASASNVVLAVDFTTSSSGDAAATLTFNFSGGTVTSVAGVATSYNGTACNTASYFGASATVLPMTSGSAAGAGSTITVSGVNALTASTQYCVFVGTTTGMTNPTAGTYTVTVTDTAASGDTTTVGLDYIANDQVVVSATVPPQFTMALSSNTDSMGNLLIASAVYSTGVTATINTNASNGWLLWAEDSNAGLKSATAGNHVIPTVATGANFNFSTATGAEHYGLAVSSITSGSANAFYAYNAGTTGGGLSTTVFNQIASATTAVSSDAVVVKEVADISATTPAASDYTDTVTLVGAGSF